MTSAQATGDRLAVQTAEHSYPTILEIYAQRRLNGLLKDGVKHLVTV